MKSDGGEWVGGQGKGCEGEGSVAVCVAAAAGCRDPPADQQEQQAGARLPEPEAGAAQAAPAPQLHQPVQSGGRAPLHPHLTPAAASPSHPCRTPAAPRRTLPGRGRTGSERDACAKRLLVGARRALRRGGGPAPQSTRCEWIPACYSGSDRLRALRPAHTSPAHTSRR